MDPAPVVVLHGRETILRSDRTPQWLLDAARELLHPEDETQDDDTSPPS